MTPTGAAARHSAAPTRHFLNGVVRAGGGAVLFSLPLLMTEEMWDLGLTMSRFRLAGLLAASLPLLVALSYFSGFEETRTLLSDVRDAVIALAVGLVTGAVVLTAIGVLDPTLSLDNLTGSVALQAVPGAIGALISRSQLGERAVGEEHDEKERGAGYRGELALMAAGALVFAFNVAPTLEVSLLAARLTIWHVVALGVLSLGAMHGFVYAAGFRGQHAADNEHPIALFFRFTVTGYALALAICAYVLWSIGRYEGASLWHAAAAAMILGLPAALGAAVARLVL